MRMEDDRVILDAVQLYKRPQGNTSLEQELLDMAQAHRTAHAVELPSPQHSSLAHGDGNEDVVEDDDSDGEHHHHHHHRSHHHHGHQHQGEEHGKEHHHHHHHQHHR